MTTDGDERTSDVDDTQPTRALETIQGVVFGKSIRSHYAILHIAIQSHIISNNGAPTNTEYEYSVVRIDFVDNPIHSPTDMRSWCRRSCKLGDLVNFNGHWMIPSSETNKFLVQVASLEHDADDLMSVAKVRHWSMPECQEWQQKYRPKVACENDSKPPAKKKIKTDQEDTSKSAATLRHGGNKRDQGVCVADFLIHIMAQSLDGKQALQTGGSSTHTVNDGSNVWKKSCISKELYDKVIATLNNGSGVVDAAGGTGYVSMALGMKGIKSTVVDARESVGTLPRRDRKVWNRLLRGVPAKTEDNVLVCQPVVPYDSLRAWFAKPPPENVDTSFRHADVDSIPVVAEDHDLLRNCSAVVALHPDEATDAIVDMAVKRRIPFVVVPCCVFSRFFTYRRKPGTNLPVTTHDDLIDYLASKDESIQRTTLPFEGANTALWSFF